MLDHERLHAYQAAVEFLALTQSVLSELPAGHAKLADQLRRAALSTPLNIAEGNAKRSARDRSRYFGYSRGSAMECGALFDALRVLELISPATHMEGKELLVRVVSMLSKLR